MSTPSPFQVAREASNNFGSAFKRVNDENAIEKILSQAMGSGNPEVIQNSIGQILSQVSPERQGVALQYLQNTFSNLQKKKEQTRIEGIEQNAAKEAGYTYGAPPQVQGQQVKDKAKNSRLAPYGLAEQPNLGQMGQPGQMQPALAGNPAIPAAGQPPQTTPNQIPASKFRDLTDDQLVQAQAHPDVEVRQGSAAEQKRRIEETKINQKDRQKTRDEELQFHKESEKYDEELLKQTKIAKKQVDTVNDIDKAIESGNVSPTSLANIFKGFGKIGDKISEALLNKDEATILASIPQLLEGWKEVFGVRLSDADLKLLQDKLPSIGKTAEANKAIVKVLKKYADMTLLRSSIAKEIKAANKGLRPLGYGDKIEQRFDEMVMPVKIINPANGRTIEIPAYKVSDAIKAGGKLANE